MYGNTKANPSICDRCGQKWPRIKLKAQVIAEKQTRLMVCPDCLDVDQPQLMIGKIRTISDPYPIRDPRPDINFNLAETGFGWNPIGGTGLTISMSPATTINPNSPPPTGLYYYGVSLDMSFYLNSQNIPIL